MGALINSGAGASTASGAITLSGATTIGGIGQTIFATGIFDNAGAQALTKIGSGIDIFQGPATTRTGTVALTAGTLRIAATSGANPLGTGAHHHHRRRPQPRADHRGRQPGDQHEFQHRPGPTPS